MFQYIRKLLTRKPIPIEANTTPIPTHNHIYRIGKKKYKRRITIISHIRSYLFMFLGVILAGFGLKGFLLPASFIDGGITGVSLLLNEITQWQLPLLIIIINVPFIALAFYFIGKRFALNSVLAILCLSIVLLKINFPQVTNDKLLVAVFGGIFLGLGIGFAIRGGAVLDGTEILAIYLSRKIGITIGDVILIFNILLFSFAAYLLSIEQALYSVLIYFSASRTIDYLVEGVDEYLGVSIVSNHSNAIRDAITHNLNKGVTIYYGKSGYTNSTTPQKDIDIVYTVITRFEIAKLEAEIEKIDPNAFIIMSKIKDIRGGLVKKRVTDKLKDKKLKN